MGKLSNPVSGCAPSRYPSLRMGLGFHYVAIGAGTTLTTSFTPTNSVISSSVRQTSSFHTNLGLRMNLYASRGYSIGYGYNVIRSTRKELPLPTFALVTRLSSRSKAQSIRHMSSQPNGNNDNSNNNKNEEDKKKEKEKEKEQKSPLNWVANFFMKIFESKPAAVGSVEMQAKNNAPAANENGSGNGNGKAKANGKSNGNGAATLVRDSSLSSSSSSVISLDTPQDYLDRLPSHLRRDATEYPTRYSMPERIVAVGDVHGDLMAFVYVLRNAGLIPSEEQLAKNQELEWDTWIGKSAFLVQVGDQLDRGDEERLILHLLLTLRDQARKQGGEVCILLGNHELMNVAFDFRFVTSGGFAEFTLLDRELELFNDEAELERLSTDCHPLFDKVPEYMKPRLVAMRPGGPTAMMMAEFNVAVIIGQYVFVHGGLKQLHLTSSSNVDFPLEQLNWETRRYLRGEGPEPRVLQLEDSPLWVRDYSNPNPRESECRELENTLKRLGASHMVVGHTPQAGGINCACEGKVWRVDTGLSAAYGGEAECLEIMNGSVYVIAEDGHRVHASSRSKRSRKAAVTNEL